MKIGTAIENHNYTEFEKLVDVKDLSNNFIDAYLEDEGKDSNGIVELMRDKMSDKFSSEIKNLVENTENDKKSGISNIFSKKLNLKNIESSEIDGDIATLNLNIGVEKLDTTLVLPAKMRKIDGNWQLFKFDNLSQFLKSINEREKLVLKKKNKPIIKEIQNALSFQDSKINFIQRDYTDYEIVIENTYKNTSKKSVKEYFMVTEFLNTEKDVLISLNCNYDWSEKPLKPNEIITETLVFGINKYETDELNSSQITQNMITKKLVFAGGDSLSVFEKL